MKFLQRFDHQKIRGKPDGPAPVRVSAEQAALRFPRLVVHAIFVAVDREDVGMRRVIFGKRADAVRRKKFFLVRACSRRIAHKLLAVHQRKQAAHAVRRSLAAVHARREAPACCRETIACAAESPAGARSAPAPASPPQTAESTPPSSALSDSAARHSAGGSRRRRIRLPHPRATIPSVPCALIACAM